MTLGQLLEAYLQTLPSRHLLPTTLAAYRRSYRHLQRALGAQTPAATLKYSDLSDYLKYMISLRFAEVVKYNHMRLARIFFRWAYQEGYLVKDPTASLRLKSCPRPAVWVPTPEQVQQFLEAPPSTGLGPRDRFVLELLYGTGLRRLELRALNVADIEPGGTGLWIRQGKGHKDRLQPLGTHLQALLRNYLDQVRPGLKPCPQEDALIVGIKGHRLGNHVVRRMLRLYADALGMTKMTHHSLRRAFATHMLLRGAPLAEVQRLLGHESPETTVLYTQIGVSEVQREYYRTHPRARRKKPRAARV